MTNTIINIQQRLETCIQQAKTLNDGVPLSEKEQVQIVALKTKLKEMEVLITEKLRENKRLKKRERLV